MTKFATYHATAKSADWCSDKRHYYPCGQGWIQEGCGEASSPPAIFKHVFDEYSFTVILILFDNNKPYALSTHTRNQKCIILGETLRFRARSRGGWGVAVREWSRGGWSWGLESERFWSGGVGVVSGGLELGVGVGGVGIEGLRSGGLESRVGVGGL